MNTKRHFSPNDKFLLEQGTILLSGTEAIVRLPFDQYRADRRAGLRTATLISGYRGSPLGGIDLILSGHRALLEQHDITFIPGVNEELGATAVYGSQLANLFPEPKYDGVLGMWYGKSPGVDRSGDIFKHANFAGTGRNGGTLVIAGDDPLSKSSSLPSQSEIALYDAQMPVLYPGNVQEIITLGRYGFELSRYSGLWVGMKIVSDVADSIATVSLASPDIQRPAWDYRGRPWSPSQNPLLLAPVSLELEREVVEGRLAAVRHFAAQHPINRITVSGAQDRIGLIAPGKTYYDVRESLARLGLPRDEDLQRHGIRLLQIGMLYPLEPALVRDFARGLEEIFVVEEKRPFLELFVRDILYHQRERPRIVGKQDEHGAALVPGYAELDTDSLLPLLRRRLPGLAAPSVPAVGTPLLPIIGSSPRRTPYYCSGCPHNRSTVVPAGALAGGGPGCHGMALLLDREQTTTLTQMGGEGAQWVGAAPFSGTPHLFQNLGDGTLFHSGYLAIRQAVAANTTITYKILYNDAVAMTGGQSPDGAMAVPQLTHALQAEGVKQIIVVADDPAKYPGQTAWASNAIVWPRERFEEAQARLQGVSGVTVLIYDQACAADLRRHRARGTAPTPVRQVVIHEELCEGCADCAVRSNCLSIVPVETEWGTKRQIHQPSCNRDYSCLEGDCPALVTVIADGVPVRRHRSLPEVAALLETRPLPAPARAASEHANIYIAGIGGTGVVTIAQILAMAAFLAGKQVKGMNQTGLSQKGGAVVSHIRLSDTPDPLAAKIGNGLADLYLVFDVVTATMPQHLARAEPSQTVAVVSESRLPTGDMVKSTTLKFPQRSYFQQLIAAHTRAADNVYLDAVALAEAWFGTHMPANLLTLGAAYQAGLLPLDAETIERAIEWNGVEAALNIMAFRLGRHWAAHPDWVGEMVTAAAPARPSPPPSLPFVEAALAPVGVSGELERLLRVRLAELVAYQDERYARAYLQFIERVLHAERALTPDETPLTEAVARCLYQLMAYKDEYEVARLYLKPAFRQQLDHAFGQQPRLRYHLLPAFLRRLSVTRKVAVPESFSFVFRVLHALKPLRGTPLDPFGASAMRRLERRLIAEYRALIETELATLSPHTLERAIRLASLPEMIRGFDSVKRRNVQRFRDEVERVRQPQASPVT